MKILGLITEYNPFHNGHLYHLQESVKKTGAGLVIAVMSGDFLQRGEPALISKWSRTRMALQGGADLVIELPYIYAVQRADIFADGAISILSELSVTDICFGSEEGSIQPFYKSVYWLNRNKSSLDKHIKTELAAGKSYPRAFSDAIKTIHSEGEMLDLGQPNNTLGYHYVASLIRRNSAAEAHTIKRIQAGYHDTSPRSEHIASATAIRKILIEKTDGIPQAASYTPDYTNSALRNFASSGRQFHTWENYFPFLQYAIMSKTEEQLRTVYECDEGLEYRLKKTVLQAGNFEEFITSLKSKRYTRTRLQRLLVHLYLNTTRQFMKQALSSKKPPYIRVLGMSEEGRTYLSSIKKQLNLPLVTQAGQMNHSVLQKDILASRLHGMIHQKAGTSFMDEYKAVPIQYVRQNRHFAT